LWPHSREWYIEEEICNHELYNLHNDVEISKKAKISRMKWAEHVLRMNNEEPTKKLMLGKPDGTRKCGRPRL
jgi:hypothetical protein